MDPVMEQFIEVVSRRLERIEAGITSQSAKLALLEAGKAARADLVPITAKLDFIIEQLGLGKGGAR